MKQDFNQILTHSFVYENAKTHGNTKRINVKKILPKFATKGSTLRDNYLKNHRAQVEATKDESNKNEWKLRQFLGIGPHDDIAESIKRSKRISSILIKLQLQI
jgi:uncharacterized membrane protein